MDMFNKITISHFIWYLVPGLGLIFFVLFPLLVFNPSVVEYFFIVLGPFGIIVLGITLGFSLEGLRLYRFRPNYSKIKNEFFQSLKDNISPDLDPYFIQAHIKDVAKNKNITELSFHHAIWIMLGQFTVLSFFEAVFWIIASAYFCFCDTPACPVNHFFNIVPKLSIFGSIVSKEIVVLVCGIFSILFISIGFRFFKTSIEDQKNTNKMFLSFSEQHSVELRKLLNVSDP